MTDQATPIILEIEERRYEVTHDQLSDLECYQENESTYLLKRGDTNYRIQLLSFDLASGICSVLIDGRAREVKVIRDIDLLIEKMGLNASQSKKQSVINAPMPGLVTDIKVVPDQHVEKGTPLMILEAMKMENVIAAPHDATIKSIKVSVGQAVERGLPLIEFSK